MKKILLTTVAVLACSQAAFAAPAKTSTTPAPEFRATTTNPTDPFNAGDILVRARVIDVAPQEKGTLSSGGTVSLDNNVVPEIDFSYFFTKNISAELIAATTRHSVLTSGGADAGRVSLLPPTLTLQYHFTNLPYAIPYVGAGVSYAHFYNEKGGAVSHVSYDDRFGAALQAGADIPLKGNWYANVDVKKLYISTEATFSAGPVAHVNIDPWIMGVGVGYKF